jgi:hypothetical protein
MTDAAKNLLASLQKNRVVYFDNQSRSGVILADAALELVGLGLAKRKLDSFLSGGKLVVSGEVVLKK